MESSSVPVAMTAGLLRPLLLVGRVARLWAVERRRVVLLHELAHVKRCDWASAFYNPPLLSLGRLLPSFLVGRTVSDSLRLGIQAVLLVIAASIIGFRFHNGFFESLAALVIAVVFGLAFSWISALIGMSVRDPEAAQKKDLLGWSYVSSSLSPNGPP